MNVEIDVRQINQKNNITMLCPYHEERMPSFMINLEKLIFHCFGCGAHGKAHFDGKRIANLEVTN